MKIFKTKESKELDDLELFKVFEDNLILARQEAITRKKEKEYLELIRKHMDATLWIPVDVDTPPYFKHQDK